VLVAPGLKTTRRACPPGGDEAVLVIPLALLVVAGLLGALLAAVLPLLAGIARLTSPLAATLVLVLALEVVVAAKTLLADIGVIAAVVALIPLIRQRPADKGAQTGESKRAAGGNLEHAAAVCLLANDA
jgi:hypothetical protein